MTDVEKMEKMMEEFAAQGRTADALKLAFNLIIQYAQRKNFLKAEALRDRLYDIDPMALNEIIKSAEIIENEKSGSIDENHKVVWVRLYETLNTEEANALYYALKSNERMYEPDEAVFRQGDKDSQLYFISGGQAKLFYTQSQAERLITTLSGGSVAGAESFFNISVCTTSLVTLSRVRINFLTPDVYARWQTELPTLATKLRHFCDLQSSAVNMMKEKGINRREHQRFKVEIPMKYQILKFSGEPLGREFKGDMSDISLGGLSFFIKTANKQQALLLLGRRLKVRFGSIATETERSGIITGVINHLFSDYSIHMKFDKPVTRAAIGQLELEDRQDPSTRIKVDRDAV